MNHHACCLLVSVLLGNRLLDTGQDKHGNQISLNHVQFQFLVPNDVNIWKTDIVLYFMGIWLL
jgi:hypothetical protein